MKIPLFVLLGGIIFCFPYGKNQKPVESPVVSSAPTPVADTIRFAAQIQPILQNHCNPCHFPGGKMYKKMPFDQAKTIIDHAEGIIRRIKDGEDGRLLRAFIGQSGK